MTCNGVDEIEARNDWIIGGLSFDEYADLYTSSKRIYNAKVAC